MIKFSSCEINEQRFMEYMKQNPIWDFAGISGGLYYSIKRRKNFLKFCE